MSIKVYASQQRNKRIKITTDKDCLPPDAIQVSEREFPDYDSILEIAELYWMRGYSVSVDTERGLVEYER
jgi:hypothetical protein